MWLVLTWLLSPESVISEKIFELENIIRSAEFEECVYNQQYLLKKIYMNNNDIEKLASETVGQD